MDDDESAGWIDCYRAAAAERPREDIDRRILLKRAGAWRYAAAAALAVACVLPALPHFNRASSAAPPDAARHFGADEGSSRVYLMSLDQRTLIDSGSVR